MTPSPQPQLRLPDTAPRVPDGLVPEGLVPPPLVRLRGRTREPISPPD